MRFRPANISLINRRHYLPRLLLTLSSKRQIQKPPRRFEDVDRVTPYHLTYRYVLATNIRTTPQYGEMGWNSLGALAGGLAAAIWTFPIAFILIFAIQRIFAAERDIDNPTDAPPNDIQ
jgi:hypothetical protein